MNSNHAELLANGHEARQSGNLEAALVSYTRAIDANPSSIWARIGLATALRELGRIPEAEACYREVLAEQPKLPQALLGLGHCAQARGDQPTALAHFEAATRIAPDDIWARIGLAGSLRALGRVEEAAARYREILAEQPSHAQAHLGLGYCAQARGDQATALRHFEAAARVSPDNIWTHMGLARSLRELGRAEEAENTLSAFAARNPGLLAPLKALADLSMHRKRWSEALRRWDELIARFPDRQDVGWLIERARALASSGRPEEALDALRAILDDFPDHHGATLRYLEILGRKDPPDDALNEIRIGRFKARRDYELSLATARFAFRADDMPCLREVLPELIAEARNPRHCFEIFNLIAPAFEGWERTSTWLQLEKRLAELPAGSTEGEFSAARIVAMRLKLALRDYSGFLGILDNGPDLADARWSRMFQRLAGVLRADAFPDYEAKKVFGIGLSKSGTTTLTSALEKLGCLTAHYCNVFTQELLTSEDAVLFDALTDATVCPEFEALFYLYPNSRFIYTTRPMEAWLASFRQHEIRWERATDFETRRRRVTTPGQTRYSTGRARSGVSLFYRYGDPVTARLAFEERVHRFFDKDRANRLLVFDVFAGDGWEKLCGFLGRCVPDEPFPWENKAPSE